MRLLEITLKGQSFPNAEDMIPHQHRMKLIDRIKNPDQNGLQAETTVKEVWPMCEGGAVSSIICIELIAQSVSAFDTWLRGPGAIPRIGLLVGVKRTEFSTAAIPINIALTITVHRISRVGNYGVFKGEVTSGPTNFCTAVIQVVDPDGNILEKIKKQNQGFREIA